MDEQLSKIGKAILKRAEGERKYRLSRYRPAEPLRSWIRHYWLVEWKLEEGETYEQELVQHPCVNLVVMPGYTRIYGIPSGKSSQRLEGHGSVFSIMFRAGGFYPLWRAPVSELADRSVPFEDVFGEPADELERRIFGTRDDLERVAVMDRYMSERIKAVPDETVETLDGLVLRIAEDRSIKRVEDAAEAVGVSVRTLQRMFRQYVGVSPKWVIDRYRLHEAADQIAEGGEIDWAQLAAELGYYDQAHFIKQFKAIVGMPPNEYKRAAGNPGAK